MKVLQINAVYPTGSTGKICQGIYQKCVENSIECHVVYSFGDKQYKEGIAINNRFFNKVANRLSRITMLECFFSPIATFKLIHLMKRIKPDIIHIHNIHENFINIKPLFKYIKKNNIATIITAHDCWFLTGYCKYFTALKCEKWKTGCSKCPKKYLDKANLFDNSKYMYRLKKEIVRHIDNLTIVVPSKWLYSLFKESVFGQRKLLVINNGIDLSVFKPTISNFREEHGISDTDFVLLGVAAIWEKRKGIDVFIELADRLNEGYRIILVGTNEKIDRVLPKNVISIHQTQDQIELARIYTVADLFVNPTREEVFGMVNVESLACGTPVITFDTGGSPEAIDNSCGMVVPCNDVDELEKSIRAIKQNTPFSSDSCIDRAKRFDLKTKFEEYIQLYKDTI